MSSSESVDIPQTASFEESLETLPPNFPPNSHPILPPMRAGVFCDKNKRFRRTMEDAHTIVHTPSHSFFAIYDGHAGKTAAQFASDKLYDLLLEEIEKGGSVLECMARTFDRIDVEMAKEERLLSGCTAVVCFIREELLDEEGAKRVLYTANVGDARAVLSRSDEAVRLTFDHKGTDGQEIKRITDAGGFVMGGRVNGVLAVTRALGDLKLKEHVIGTPYTTQTVLDGQDSVLIIACDGVWDVLSDQDAVDLVRGVEDVQQASEMLVMESLEKGSMDNITALVVRLH